MKMTGTILFVPLEVATTPAEGHCFVNRWWAVHPEKGVAFYARLRGFAASEEPSPQCNSDERVARHVTARLYPECEVQHLPAVYLRPAQNEMERLRKAAS